VSFNLFLDAGGKFAQSIRPSMDMKTLGPGPAYDLSGKTIDPPINN
jgi:hypothetical protein